MPHPSDRHPPVTITHHPAWAVRLLTVMAVLAAAITGLGTATAPAAHALPSTNPYIWVNDLGQVPPTVSQVIRSEWIQSMPYHGFYSGTGPVANIVATGCSLVGGKKLSILKQVGINVGCGQAAEVLVRRYAKEFVEAKDKRECVRVRFYPNSFVQIFNEGRARYCPPMVHTPPPAPATSGPPVGIPPRPPSQPVVYQPPRTNTPPPVTAPRPNPPVTQPARPAPPPVTSTVPAASYTFTWLGQGITAMDGSPIDAEHLQPGAKVAAHITVRYSGNRDIPAGRLLLATGDDQPSLLHDGMWPASTRAATTGHMNITRPGDTVRFATVLTAPAAGHTVIQHWRVVAEGISWLTGPDMWLRLRAVAPPPTILTTPAGGGTIRHPDAPPLASTAPDPAASGEFTPTFSIPRYLAEFTTTDSTVLRVDAPGTAQSAWAAEWRVDGDRWVTLPVDGTGKAMTISFASWNWKPSGQPYVIDIVARALDGSKAVSTQAQVIVR